MRYPGWGTKTKRTGPLRGGAGQSRDPLEAPGSLCQPVPVSQQGFGARGPTFCVPWAPPGSFVTPQVQPCIASRRFL